MNNASRFLGACFLGLGCIAAGHSAAGHEVPVVRVCDILKAPSSFDGREVIASGVAGSSFHRVLLWDPECSLPKHGGAMWIRFADNYELGKAGDKKYLRMLRKEGAAGVTVRGRFISRLTSTDGPFDEFLISSVIEVRKLSKAYRQQFDIGTGKFGEEP